MYIAIKNEKIIGIYADNEREGLIDVGIIPSPEEIPGKMDYGETVNELIRRKYTLSEELAILRQRGTKAEEFEAYNAYAESCKEEARLLIEKQKH